MAVSRRSGYYGIYYGNTYNTSNSMGRDKQQYNAKYIWYALQNNGWTLNAVCGMLGNMQAESAINPGRWQSDRVGNMSGGYGLVQWTPATKYINWIGVSNDPSTMDNNLSRIKWEAINNKQWRKSKQYPISFKEFKSSTASVEYLAGAFLYNYERPAKYNLAPRVRNALYWWNYLGGVTPPPEDETKKRKFPWVLYARKFRNRRLTPIK